MIGILLALWLQIAVSSTVPQIRKASRTEKSDDVSIRFLIILIIGLSLLVVY